MPSTLNPYVTFNGNAREAMEFYRGVFGGHLETSTWGEGGMSDDPADTDRLMHAQLDADNGMTLMGSDSPSARPSTTESNISISLSGDDEAALSGYFGKLAEGGTVTMPLEKAVWGDQFEVVVDRFGVTWLVNIAGTSQP